MATLAGAVAALARQTHWGRGPVLFALLQKRHVWSLHLQPQLDGWPEAAAHLPGALAAALPVLAAQLQPLLPLLCVLPPDRLEAAGHLPLTAAASAQLVAADSCHVAQTRACICACHSLDMLDCLEDHCMQRLAAI